LTLSFLSIQQQHQQQNVVPVGVCQALTLAMGNAAYIYLTVSFIQMLKAATPIFVLAIGIAFGIEKAEFKVIYGGVDLGVGQR